MSLGSNYLLGQSAYFRELKTNSAHLHGLTATKQHTVTMKKKIKQIVEASAELCVVLQNPTLEKNNESLTMFRCRMYLQQKRRLA
jgi:hypothetical protein